ncbi:bifunctional transcriptional activator/DNA repair enzyme AdaA [Brevibacillus choshinensis]|uniref:bifunctional transcriptional activator/DNA repair enzyme AdaA n=1 Tax=Brevibacillus choshinensis TaxID=54911 RepID=UPI002E21F183|nr:bifunctional transcriptional activator/DNA repair enzyme AdaA [Brevibacillus choshinensis]MED4753947.1 bifunctional transcriptional activator/DNA repair enzyme AdaA [Brevibacillus choshinensis]MED4779078.1 bifunctional transcriptional activator/DNA repair enzyme AdaA [Brevibacillus choshinensis]
MEIASTNQHQLTDEKWQAIIHNDASYDGSFFYAVKTTRIFCRPSCKSKAPNKENVRIFANPQQALTAKFRPCKRCKPTGQRLPDREWVEQITQYIDEHFRERLTLESLAEECHGSPYHLHRTFKRIKGVTPVEYVQQTRIQAAQEMLVHTDHSIAEIASSVGMQNTPYFMTLFKKMTGRTPTEYRQFTHNLPSAEVFVHEK